MMPMRQPLRDLSSVLTCGLYNQDNSMNNCVTSSIGRAKMYWLMSRQSEAVSQVLAFGALENGSSLVPTFDESVSQCCKIKWFALNLI